MIPSGVPAPGVAGGGGGGSAEVAGLLGTEWRKGLLIARSVERSKPGSRPQDHENPRDLGGKVDLIGIGLQNGESALDSVPKLLKRLLAENMWQEFTTLRGELVHYERFEDFVTTPALKGLGTTVELIRRVVADDTETVDLLDRALQNPTGCHNVTVKAPTGNADAKALRRLRKDSPELHAEVLAGTLSAQTPRKQNDARENQGGHSRAEP